MRSQESAEMYLETILILQQKKGQVRAIDIAGELNFSKPSVSNAMKLLQAQELILIDDGKLISLTPAGQEIAEEIYERHLLLSEYLMRLGVSEETATQDACRIEHVISRESFQKIKEHCEKNIK
ncbi:MAG: metal-dependent transcriptional regulator [Peptococcaceae bacterium]|nr:metal-dependent transcriptional regulator [Peptococcaceae bacterium]